MVDKSQKQYLLLLCKDPGCFKYEEVKVGSIKPTLMDVLKVILERKERYEVAKIIEEEVVVKRKVDTEIAIVDCDVEKLKAYVESCRMTDILALHLSFGVMGIIFGVAFALHDIFYSSLGYLLGVIIGIVDTVFILKHRAGVEKNEK